MAEKERRDDENGKVGGDEGRGAGIEASRVVDTLGSWQPLVPHGRERYARQEEDNNPSDAFGYDKNQNCITDSSFDGKDTNPDVLEQD